MVTAAFEKFIIALFVLCLIGCAICYVREWMIAQVTYANEQAKKKIAYAESHKKDSEDMAYWLEYYFGEEKCNEN